MTPDEIEAAIKAAFNQCDVASCPLDEQQKQILLEVVFEEIARNQPSEPSNNGSLNPLDALTTEQRFALLQFVQEQESQEQPWKIKLWNDWLNNQDSGSVQFIRDDYGPQWLHRVKPVHLAEYYEREAKEPLKLKVGDRIEVSNGLWEWVQDGGPCSREWFPCIVIGLYETSESEPIYTSCVIRFDGGPEYEIQGIYEWNRYNWRW